MTRRHAEATKWYRLAAERRSAYAQYTLGFLCDTGQGVPRDAVQAFVWYNLAARYCSASQIKSREAAVKSGEAIAARLNPDQIAEAHRRVTGWQSAHAQVS